MKKHEPLDLIADTPAPPLTPAARAKLVAEVKLWQVRSVTMLLMGIAIGALLCYLVGQAARYLK